MANPTSAEECNNLGATLGLQGEHRRACELFRQAIALRPDYGEAHNNLGIALRDLGDLDAALAAFQRASELKPDHFDAHSNIGHTLRLMGMLDAAVVAFRKATELRADSSEAHNNLGNALAETQHLEESLASYREALRLKPNNPKVLNNLAIVLAKLGRPSDAVECYHRALQLAPKYADAWYNLGMTQVQLGNREEAIRSFRRATELNSNHADAHRQLGITFAQLGRWPEAARALRDAVRIRPADAELQRRLAMSLAEAGRYQDAVTAFSAVLRDNPNDAEGHNNLGIALAKQRKFDEAAKNFRHALELKPDYAEAHNNLGNALRDSDNGNLHDAITCYHRALQLRPEYPDAYNNLGIALDRSGKTEEGIDSFRQALRLNPRSVDAYNNLGITLAERRQLQESLESFGEALRHKPDYADAHWNRSLVWLLMGDYERGWEEYEWRWNRTGTSPRSLRQPLWDGSPLEGRTILLHAEQGLGDTIQFIRYAPLVKRLGGTVIVECQKRLVPLLARCDGIDRLMPHGSQLPTFDVHAPLMSLPRILGTRVDTVPASVPYVFPDRDLAELWRSKLANIPGFKIGVNWQGNPRFRSDHFRSIPLLEFEPLAHVPEVRLISLQKGTGCEQLEEVRRRFDVIDLGSQLDEHGAAFTDTAAVMLNLDLVITSDTSIPHLAGALGVPVWMATSFVPDWRWLLDREDSPWYPTMRLFRQSGAGQWDEVFQRMAAELHELVSRGAPVRTGAGAHWLKPAQSSATITQRSAVERYDAHHHAPAENATNDGQIMIPVAPGELADKITILELKSARINDHRKLENVRTELAILSDVWRRAEIQAEEVQRALRELKAINERLWEIEDAIRECERAKDFGLRFIELARSVYQNNDLRAALKRRINELLGSKLVEEKQYVGYQ